MDQHPELEPWRCPDAEQWAEQWQNMTKPDSEMKRLGARYEATIKKTISDQIKRYQSEALARLRAKGLDAQGEKNSGGDPSARLAAGRPSDPTKTDGETGGADPATQQSELPRNVRTPLEHEVIRPSRELPPESEGGAIAGFSPGLRLFRKSGDVWELAFEGLTVHVKHSKGMEYIVHLLRSPNQLVDSVQLLMAAVDERKAPVLGSADATLDRTAINQYRSRAKDLKVELAEAERFHDDSRKEAAQVELEHLTEHLLSARGLGGRRRNTHDDAEKIRKGVGNAITRALNSIRKHHPALTHHLKRSIDLGLMIVYQGDGIDWQF